MFYTLWEVGCGGGRATVGVERKGNGKQTKKKKKNLTSLRQNLVACIGHSSKITTVTEG